MSTPAFVQPGGTFTAEVLAPDSLPAAGWQAWLTTDLGKRWPCQVTSAVRGRDNLDLGARSGWRLTVRVPPGVVPELCRLGIRAPGSDAGAAPQGAPAAAAANVRAAGAQGAPPAGASNAPLAAASGAAEERDRAVSVVPELESSFYIVVLTDDHLFSDHVERYRTEAQKRSGFHSADLVRLSAKVANIANPRFVLKLGDFSTVQAFSRKHAIEKWFIPALDAFRVPTLITSGNHEHDVWADIARTRPAEYTTADWENDFGARSFVTRLGSFYVLSHEFGCYQATPHFDADLLARVKKRYTADCADPSIRFRLIAQHGIDGALGTFLPEMVGRSCDLMLNGHDHRTAIKKAGPLYYRLGVTTAQEWAGCVWFAFNRQPDGSWACPQAGPEYSDANNTVRLVNDAGAGDVKLKERFLRPNDGTARETSNTCTLTNEIPFAFPDGRVRFLMPRGTYRVTGGALLGQYDYLSGGETRTAVVCRVAIPPKTTADGTVAVTVRPE